MITALLIATCLTAAPVPDSGPVTPATSGKSTVALLAEARAHMADLDFDRALPLLEDALSDTALTGSPRAQALLDLGLTLANLGEPDRAKEVFAQAFGIEPHAALPPHTAPKVVELFEAARPPIATTADDADDGEEAATPPPPAPVVVAPPPPPPPSLLKPAICGGVAAAGLSVGIGFGLSSSEAKATLERGVASRATADALLSRQREAATASIVGYGVGVLALVATASLLYLDTPARVPAVAAVAPLPGGGAAVSVALRLPSPGEPGTSR
ncbi:MAG: hypothetical protein JST54_09255 [Deltaproteobacteria bacterium]|nr:hypothetical protein [Deltaproteobacteria bacterium]